MLYFLIDTPSYQQYTHNKTKYHSAYFNPVFVLPDVELKCQFEVSIEEGLASFGEIMIIPVFLHGYAPQTLNVSCHFFHLLVEIMLQFEFYLEEVNLRIVAAYFPTFPFCLLFSFIDLFMNPPNLGVVLEPKTVTKFAQPVDYLHTQISPSLFQLKGSVGNVDGVSHIFDQSSSLFNVSLQLINLVLIQWSHLTVRQKTTQFVIHPFHFEHLLQPLLFPQRLLRILVHRLILILHLQKCLPKHFFFPHHLDNLPSPQSLSILNHILTEIIDNLQIGARFLEKYSAKINPIESNTVKNGRLAQLIHRIGIGFVFKQQLDDFPRFIASVFDNSRQGSMFHGRLPPLQVLTTPLHPLLYFLNRPLHKHPEPPLTAPQLLYHKKVNIIKPVKSSSHRILTPSISNIYQYDQQT